MGANGVIGLDRGFLYPPDSDGVPWVGLTSLEEQEDGFRLETYHVDGRKVGHRHVAGNYTATLASYDDPFKDRKYEGVLFGVSYREMLSNDDYRLHIVQGLSVSKAGFTRSSVNPTPTPETHSWYMAAVDIPLGDDVHGSHLILDSALIYPWVLRDIEAVLYGYPNGGARIPTIDEIYDIFATMNLVIIDHGDGTWSAVGHDVMVAMLDSTEFMISSPTVEMVDGEEHTYDVESLIRDDRWLE